MDSKLRIAHVFAVHSRDGIYGGPARVAIDQAVMQSEMGHDVTIFAGWAGEGAPPNDIEGVTCYLKAIITVVPRFGFAGQYAPGLWSEFARRSDDFDIVHVHVARDFITLPISAFLSRKGQPYVLQPHGMIMPSSKRLSRPLDWAWTKTGLKRAGAILALSRSEADGLASLGALPSAISIVGNGIITGNRRQRSEVATKDILFLARLHPRKRPVLFVEAALELAPNWPDVTFSLVGPDEGESANVETLIASSNAAAQVRWTGPIHPGGVLDRMSRSSIYVLPAMDEPFGLTLIEAMSIGLPVVVGETSELAAAIVNAGAGVTYDGTSQSLARQIENLIADESNMRAMGQNGIDYVEGHWSLHKIATQVVALYRVAISGPRNDTDRLDQIA
jgi:glycosyltransferase involved in cell wall biosynthesis